ncbi:hypothetical protein, partial [Cetobacterium sp.]|uniref:hypothetical protein n=1 Tax=Cetobacterium sp. TaxID=2071632 RepID=UPI003F2CF943
MSKKQRKISLIFIGFLLALLTIVSFAEPPEAPNQLITENPYKEVKTVEANKNREHAEMNIGVNKLNPKVLNGYKLSDTEYYIELPSEEILKQNETYYISKTLEDLPDIYSVNGKKTIVNLNKFENYSIETADFNYGFTDNIILIDKAPLDIKKFIISKLDKTSGEIKKVYEVKDIKSAEINKLHSEIRNEESEYIVFALNDEILKELTIGTEIKIGKNFSQILKNENTRKHNKRNSELFYKIDKEKKQLLVENRKDVNEIKIITLNNEKINRIYTGNIYLKSNIETNALVTFDINNFNMIKLYTDKPNVHPFFYGSMRIYPTSNSDLSAKMGFIDETGQVVTDNRKNGQFLQGKITGTTYPLQKHHFGKTMYITVGSERRAVKIADDPNGNPILGLGEFFEVGNATSIGIAYLPLGTSNGGINIGVRTWQTFLQNTIVIKLEFPDGAVSNYMIKIPKLEGKNYYNEDLPLANEYLPKKRYTKEINQFINGELDTIKVGTKDYDLRIFGRTFGIRVPRKITLEATDFENNTQNLTFAVSLSELQNATSKIVGDNYIISPGTSGGFEKNSAMDFDIILTSNHSLNNLKTLKGKKIGLVEMLPGYDFIIDEIEYKINFKNISETIDVSSLKILENLFTNNEFTGLIQNENRIVLKDG